MAIGATQANGSGGVHGRRVGLSMAGNAADAVAIGIFLRFTQSRCPGLLA
jgi:hypothetical protein